MGIEKYEAVPWLHEGVMVDGMSHNGPCDSCDAHEECAGWDVSHTSPFENMCEMPGDADIYTLKLKAELPFEVKIGDKVCEPVTAEEAEISIPAVTEKDFDVLVKRVAGFVACGECDAKELCRNFVGGSGLNNPFSMKCLCPDIVVPGGAATILVKR